MQKYYQIRGIGFVLHIIAYYSQRKCQNHRPCFRIGQTAVELSLQPIGKYFQLSTTKMK